MLPPMVKVSVYGLRRAPIFQHARLAAETVQRTHKRDVEVTIHDLNECDWQHQRFLLKQNNPTSSHYTEDAVVVVNGQVQSSLREFLGWISEEFNYTEDRSEPLLKAIAAEAELSYRQNCKNDFVYFDIAMDGQAVGRMVFELFTPVVPKTCKNFMELCIGQTDSTTKTDTKLRYAGSLIHRIQKHGWIQGGDIFGSAGDQGESIYGPTFEDENFQIPFSKRGILAMANNGLHTNSSQFFVTFRALDWMNTKFVAFGQLYEGVDVLQKLEDEPTYNQRPIRDCKIVACGRLGNA